MPRRLLIALWAALAASAAAPAGALDEQREDVRAFVGEMAARHGFAAAELERVFAEAQSRPSIIAAMSRPAERAKPWYEYRALFVTDRRVTRGVDTARLQADALAAAAARGVAPEVILAITGVETMYGENTGSHRVIDALATLAFDYPPRAGYFRSELEQFLLLSREAGVDPLTATGSYAGAMGAPQFMPRSFRAFARDGNRDGRIDLWGSWPDIAESVANYFVANGWRRGEPLYVSAELWDPDVEGLPGNRLELAESVGSLRARGVEFDSPLPDDAQAMFIALRDADAPSYRVGFHNFWVITRYNRSAMYALATAELAAALAAAPAETPAPETPSPPQPDPAVAPTGAPTPGAGR